MRILITTLALISPVIASGQPNPQLMQLGALFQQESAQMQSDICTRRFPASAPAWEEATSHWKQRYKDDLAKLSASAMKLTSALEVLPANARPLNLSDLLAFQAQSVTYVLYGLAGTPDTGASALCDEMRAALTDEARVRQGFSIAQAAADEALRTVK